MFELLEKGEGIRKIHYALFIMKHKYIDVYSLHVKQVIVFDCLVSEVNLIGFWEVMC